MISHTYKASPCQQSELPQHEKGLLFSSR